MSKPYKPYDARQAKYKKKRQAAKVAGDKAAYYKYKLKKDQAAMKEKERRIANTKSPSYISAAGGMAGSALGSMFGPAGSTLGGFLGGKLGHLIEQITGFGDYKVNSNTILSGGMSPPQIINSVDKGGVIIRHREYLADIKATTAFTVQKFPIQPANPLTFPWLSQIANSYEQYRLRGVLFEFKSTSSDALLSSATSTALGTVNMMTDYDVSDLPPASKREMLNSEWSCSDKPSCTFIHPIECKKSISFNDILYTRASSTLPANADPKLYDFGNFYIATEGMQAAGGVLGELWCTYEIELFKQQSAYVGLADHFRTTSITAARPFGTDTGTNLANGATLGGSLSADGLSYLFPPTVSSGKYFLCYSVLGGGAPNVSFPNTFTYVNCQILNYLFNNTLNQEDAPEPAVASNINTAIIIATVLVTGQNASISTPNTGVYPGATNAGDLFIFRMPDSMI